jgi:hypothetical protein
MSDLKNNSLQLQPKLHDPEIRDDFIVPPPFGACAA